MKKIFIFALIFFIAQNCSQAYGLVIKPKSSISVFYSANPPYVILGTQHSFNPKNKQLIDIENIYRKFQPTLVLVEGGVWPIAETRLKAIQCCGEMGFLQFLAYQNKVKYDTWEGSDREETLHVLEEFKPEDIKLFYALRMAPQFLNERKKAQAEELMNEFLSTTGELAKINNLKGTPNNTDEINQMLKRLSYNKNSWYTIKSAMIFDQLIEKPNFYTLKKIKDSVNKFRDQQAINRIDAAILNKERVMFIGGDLHFNHIMMHLK